MAKAESTAYVALPMDLADNVAAQRSKREEVSVCATFGKLCIVAAAISLVVVGGMHMSSCGGKHSNQKKSQLRNHHFDAWNPHSGHQHGMDAPGPHHWGPGGHYPKDALPGPHHVTHGTFLGPDHYREHDEQLPAVLRHPMHKPGKNQAVMHVHDEHPDPTDELKKIKKNQQVIKHVIDSTHHNTLPQELRHPSHHGSKLNTVKVQKAVHEPEDKENHPTDEVDVEMPDILRHPPKRTNGNGKQGTYVVHRHHDAPAPREAPAQESSSEDAKLDAELEELERDFNEDFGHENQGLEEEKEEEEEYDAKLETELEQLEHDMEEDFDEFDWDSEEEDNFEGSDDEDEDDWESEDEDEEDEDDWEIEMEEEWDENDLDEEILEAFEDAEDEDVEVIVVEERLEEP